jgi:hypothetical protein
LSRQKEFLQVFIVYGMMYGGGIVMESYGEFAKVYDIFMDTCNYEDWAGYIRERLTEDGITDAWCWSLAAVPGP